MGTIRGWGAALAACGLVAVAGCGELSLDATPDVVYARFNPEDGVVPMPTDLLRDEDAGRLDLDTDDEDLSAAEREVYEFLNTMDAWSTTQTARVEFSSPIDPSTVNADTLEVWRWTGADEPYRIENVTIEFEDDDKRLVINAPLEGWERGGKYFIAVRGNTGGVRGRRGEPVEADAAFYFLRLTERLNDPEFQRAFPGNTRAERLEKGEDLEEARQKLAPYFDFLERRGTAREDIAALWGFSVTNRVELAMDRASQRIPIPFDLLYNFEEGHVELADAEWDKAIERKAKHKLKDFDGFAISAELLFGFTAPVNTETVNENTVEFYELSDPPVRLPAKVETYDGGTQVAVIPETLPLKQKTTYGIVVREGIVGANGEPVEPMLIGEVMRSTSVFAVNGKSEAKAIADDSAIKLETVRSRLAPLLDHVGREGVLTAWPFTTMDAASRLDDIARRSDALALDPNPTILKEQSALEAALDFPLGLGTILNVDRVYTGTIKSPVYLDEKTRGFREDGGYDVEDVTFTLTVPRKVTEGKPVPVVVFGHGIMTERRFVLAIADSLASRGIAAISIDLPFHGTRTRCVGTSPLAVVNPQTGEATSMKPCSAGAVCNEYNMCVGQNGESAFATFPVVNMRTASGAAFLEIDELPDIRDHFLQSYIDLGSLVRALREGDWKTGTGIELAGDKPYWVGQSLGGIIGATFVALIPEFQRAVLNVPGADLVDMFDNSTFFGPQIDGYFVRNEIERSGYEGRRFLNIARWLIDPVDPQSVAERYQERPGQAFIQMAKGDFIVPNSSTDILENLSKLPRYEYLGTHAFLTIPVDPAYLPGLHDMADFVTGKLEP